MIDLLLRGGILSFGERNSRLREAAWEIPPARHKKKPRPAQSHRFLLLPLADFTFKAVLVGILRDGGGMAPPKQAVQKPLSVLSASFTTSWMLR